MTTGGSRPHARAFAALLVASAALAPSAHAAGVWENAGTDIPGSVELKDVAVYTAGGGSQVVVAVGVDRVTKQPVVYRLSGGTLTPETVEAAGPPAARAGSSRTRPTASTRCTRSRTRS